MELSVSKIIRVIALARENARAGLLSYIDSLNEDEQAELVALMWIGRETFDPSDWNEAVDTALAEGTAPTAEYLSSEPLLPDYLEDGMDAIGLDVAEEESAL